MPKSNKLKDDKFFLKKPIRRVTQKQCLRNYVKYKTPKYISKKNNNSLSWSNKMDFWTKYNSLPIIEGYWFNSLKDKRKIVAPMHDFGKCHLYNNISSDIEYIPNDYIEVKLTDKELKGKKTDYACKNPSKKIINLEKKGLNHENWELHNKKEWLTIADIEKMKKGDQIKVLLLDRNVMDIVTENVKCNKIYKPTEFYKKSWVIYTYDKPTEGLMQLYYEINSNENKKRIKNNKSKKNNSILENNKNNSTLENNRNTPFKIDLEINYKEGSWYPLRNGYLPAKDENWKTNLLDGKKKKWTTFPKDTPIGFRGPMILWDKLDKLPNIYLLDLE
mgnify:CR=1 FL=1